MESERRQPGPETARPGAAASYPVMTAVEAAFRCPSSTTILPPPPPRFSNSDSHPTPLRGVPTHGPSFLTGLSKRLFDAARAPTLILDR